MARWRLTWTMSHTSRGLLNMVYVSLSLGTAGAKLDSSFSTVEANIDHAKHQQGLSELGLGWNAKEGAIARRLEAIASRLEAKTHGCSWPLMAFHGWRHFWNSPNLL